jgi:DNA-binding transcriptional LysR family regulator
LIGAAYPAPVELRQLRYVVTVADQLHFGRAAGQLGIAQPSLSQQIKNLEIELGVRLFERDTRRVALTEAGQAYVQEARAILARVHDAALVAQRAERGEVGRLSLGFVGFAALDTLPPLIGAFRRKFPDVLLRLHELSNENQIRGVLDGTLDVGIVREPATTTRIRFQSTFRDVQVVALPASHRLATQKQVKLRDLRDDPFIMTPRDNGFALYERIIGACVKAGFSPKIAQEAVMMMTGLGLVAAEVGVAIVPSLAVALHLPTVVFRPLSPAVVVHTGLIWDAEALAERPVVQALLATAREVFNSTRRTA